MCFTQAVKDGMVLEMKVGAHGCLLSTYKTTWCPHIALLNNIGLVLHNQTWHTHHVIVVHMKLSEFYSVQSTSRSCLHFFLCSPYMPLHDWLFGFLSVEAVFYFSFLSWWSSFFVCTICCLCVYTFVSFSSFFSSFLCISLYPEWLNLLASHTTVSG